MAFPTRGTAKAPKSPESFISLQNRNDAARILQSYEKLSWYSFQRGESMTQTRLHFQNIVAGFTPEDEAALVDWKEDFAPLPPKPGVDPRPSRKGKERVSSGGGGDGIADSSSPGGSKAQARDKDSSAANGSVTQSKKKRESGAGERGA